ncbi:MAG: hypothetical protein ACEY3L_05780, partial [Wolbachia sp.]
STEKEDKKAEKTSLKEENKEVCEDVEMKVDEREKPKVPVSLFEVSPGFVRPVVLSKPELEAVSDPLKHLLRPAELERKSHENSQKPEKVNEEEKKAEQQKEDGRTTAPKPATETGKVRDEEIHRCNSRWESNRGLSSSQPAQKPVFDGKNSEQSAKILVFNGEAPEQSAKSSVLNKGTSGQFVKSSVADCGFDFTKMGTWNGAENEPKQCSVGGAQEDPRSKVTDVLNERAARGNGNAPSR